jgi:hypothetical protein
VYCIQFNGTIYTAIMKEPHYIYIYITHHGHEYIINIHRLIRRAWSLLQTVTHTNLILHFTLLNEPGNSILLSDL